MTNIEKLQSAKILPVPNILSDEDTNKINALDPSEIEALCSIKAQLGAEFIERNTCLIL